MGKPVKALVVDDEAWIRALLRNMVDWKGLGIALAGEAETAGEALALCAACRPDILVTDIRMPGMDGLELIAAARKVLPDLQAVIVSGYDDFQYAQQAIREKVLDYVLKPIGKAAIESVLSAAAAAVRKRRCSEEEARSQRSKLRKLEAALLDADSPPDRDGQGLDLRIARARAYVAEHCAENPTLDRAAEIACMNRTYFSETFKRETGQGYGEFLRELRLERGRKLLETTDLTVREVASSLSFPDPAYFARAFRRSYGEAPDAYRSRVRPMRGVPH